MSAPLKFSEGNEYQSFVEETEYLKERARRIAAVIAAQLDFEKVQEDPDGHMAYLIALLLDQLDQLIIDPARAAATTLATQVGFEDSPDTLDDDITSALQIIEEDLTNAADDWAATLDDRLNAMNQSGVSPDVIATATAPGSTFARAMIAALAALMSSAAANAVNVVTSVVMDRYNETNGGPDALRRWVTASSSKTPSCDGDVATACAPRHGLVKTMTEWLKLGEPNAPHLNCVVWNDSEVCRCVLVPEGYQTSSPLSLFDAILRGRTRGRS